MKPNWVSLEALSSKTQPMRSFNYFLDFSLTTTLAWLQLSISNGNSTARNDCFVIFVSWQHSDLFHSHHDISKKCRPNIGRFFKQELKYFYDISPNHAWNYWRRCWKVIKICSNEKNCKTLAVVASSIIKTWDFSHPLGILKLLAFRTFCRD